MINTLQLDHVLIWVDKDAPEIEIFKESGFTSIISGKHPGQGTSGKYVFFLNFYIELLYISDSTEAMNNLDSFGCNYIERSKWRLNSSSPFGLGLKMTSFNKKNIPFDYSEYKASWMPENGLLMANNNKNLNDPLIFLLYPFMEFPNYNSMEEMLNDDKPEDFKKNHIHNNGIKALTSYKISIKTKTELSETLNELEKSGINIIKGEEDKLELIFDNNINNKEIDFRPNLPVVIRY
jgi:hypothetical protein